MSTDYAYDEEGYLWPFFVFTLTTIITLPLTYILISRSRDPAAQFTRVQSDFKHEQSQLVDTLRKAEKRKDRKLWLAGMVVGGWAIMGYMLYLISVTEVPSLKLWNPYDILNIDESILTLSGWNMSESFLYVLLMTFSVADSGMLRIS